jgi:hypothetical protein
VVLAGHGRLEAARLEGLDQVPIVRVGHLTAAQKRAYAIADNKIAEQAGWDRELLALELQELSVALNFDVTVTGFETAEIDLLIGELDQDKPDETDNVPAIDRSKPAISQLGDLWRIGNHNLFCGDALDRASYQALLGSKKAQMVFTDPPYNVPIAGNVSGLGRVKHREFVMASGEMTQVGFTKFLKTSFERLTAFSANGSPSKMYPEILRRDFSAFVHRSFLELNGRTPFLSNWHLEVLVAKLEDVRQGRCRRLVINIPPRHLKSHTATIAFPAWLLGHDPFKRILTVCYAQDFSDKLARDSRTLMISPFYRALFDTRLSPDRQAVGEFETTEGGYRFSSSVGGVVTGRGADIIIIDDPMKAGDAISDARRNSLNEWYDNTLRSRLNSQEEGAIILVMQRLTASLYSR